MIRFSSRPRTLHLSMLQASPIQQLSHLQGYSQEVKEFINQKNLF
jgi:hypothetical protein